MYVVSLSYNKTLFEENNVKTPREYFDEGKWTWDSFAEVGHQMTKDIDADNEIDIYGFGWWDSFWIQMLNANGETSMLYGEDGSIKSNFKSQSVKETIQFLQEAYSEKGFIKRPDGDSFINEFKQGKLAMTCEYGFSGKSLFEGNYEVEWAPLPVGPSGKEYDGGGSMNGLSIPVTSKNPEGAAAFIRMAYELLLDYNRKQRVEKFGLEEVDLMNALSKEINFSTIGVENYWDAQWTIYDGIINRLPIDEFTSRADERINEGVRNMRNQQ